MGMNAIPWGSTYTHRGYILHDEIIRMVCIFIQNLEGPNVGTTKNAKVITHRTYVMHIWFTTHDVHI